MRPTSEIEKSLRIPSILKDCFDFVKFLISHRKLGNQSKPLVTISQEGDEWTFKQESLVKTSETKFKMGEQFEVNQCCLSEEFVHRIFL